MENRPLLLLLYTMSCKILDTILGVGHKRRRNRCQDVDCIGDVAAGLPTYHEYQTKERRSVGNIANRESNQAPQNQTILRNQIKSECMPSSQFQLSASFSACSFLRRHTIKLIHLDVVGLGIDTEMHMP